MALSFIVDRQFTIKVFSAQGEIFSLGRELSPVIAVFRQLRLYLAPICI